LAPVAVGATPSLMPGIVVVKTGLELVSSRK
jgi:hypothetical protein